MTESTDRDVPWMDRALELGRQGEPSPNPHVGAVLLSHVGTLNLLECQCIGTQPIVNNE